MANTKQQQPEEIQVSKSEQFVEKNWKNVLYAIVALVVVIVCYFGVNQLSESKNVEASNSEALYQAQFDFEQGNYASALENFESVINEFGSTKSGNLAKAYAGLCQMNLGDVDAAIAYLKEFDGSDAIVAPAILSALGDCYVAKEAYADAAKSFEKAASKANNAQFSPLYLKKAGLAFEKSGENAKALKVYETIKNDYADSELVNSIDKYIVRVKKD